MMISNLDTTYINLIPQKRYYKLYPCRIGLNLEHRFLSYKCLPVNFCFKDYFLISILSILENSLFNFQSMHKYLQVGIH